MNKEPSPNQSGSKGTKHGHTYNYIPILLVGKTCSLLITIMGVAYFFLILGLLITGNFQLPPPVLAQNMGAIVDLTIYSILGLISFISFLFNSILVNVGFVAWGLVLYVATWLLYRYLGLKYS